MNRWMYLIVGMALGLIGGFFLYQNDRERPILFPSATFYDAGDIVLFQGSIYSDQDDDPPINNYLEVECYQSRMECGVTGIDQIGRIQTSGFSELTIPVSRWGEDLVIASSESERGQACTYFEMRINRQTEHVDYNRYVNPDATDSMCSIVSDRRWWIDNGRGWGMDADGTSRR